MLTDERIQLRATPEAWEKLSLAIRLSPGEVGGLASVHPDGADWVMTAVHLIDQQATDVTNELGRCQSQSPSARLPGTC